MEFRSSWIETGLDTQRPPGLQLLTQFRLDQQFITSPLDDGELLFYGQLEGFTMRKTS
jgi:hypothetical protein